MYMVHVCFMSDVVAVCGSGNVCGVATVIEDIALCLPWSVEVRCMFV